MPASPRVAEASATDPAKACPAPVRHFATESVASEVVLVAAAAESEPKQRRLSGHTLGAASGLQTAEVCQSYERVTTLDAVEMGARLEAVLKTPEVWQSYARVTTLDAVEMRARLEAIAQAGHVATLPRPPVAALRRYGLWRNILIMPESNPRSVHLEQRCTEQLWHPRHGAPTERRGVMDEAHALLRALHTSLPLHRVTTPTRTCKDADVFARRYGKKLASELEAAGAMTEEERLHVHTARSVLVRWFLAMARPKKGSGNAFQWHGFWLRADTEGVAYCEDALRRVLPTDAL